MRGKLWFIGGVAVGFVLGARAGRERYDELVLNARKVMDHPTVQEAAGVAQAQANRIYAEGKERLSHTRLGERLNGHDHLTAPADSLADAGLGTAGSPGSTGAPAAANKPGKGTGSAGSVS